MFKRFCGISIIILLLMLCGHFYAYCAVSERPEIVLRSEFYKARYYIDMRQYDKAINEFRKIANENKGTDVGGTALLMMVDYLSKEESIKVYKELIRDYEGSRYWLIGRIGVIGHSYDPIEDRDIIIKKINEVLMDVGGESIFNITSGKKSSFSADRIPAHLRNDMANRYFLIGCLYNSVDKKKEFRIYRFIREKFPKFNWENMDGEIMTVVMEMNDLNSTVGFPKDTYPPTVWPIQPRPKVLLFRRRPWIYVKMFDGDISQSQIDLPKLVFTLDGQDLTNDMTVRSKIDTSGRVHKRRPWKHPFEVLKIRYRPKHKLAPGKHTIYIKVPDGLGHVTEKTWTFRVKKGCRHPDDDKDDDEAPPEDD